MFVLTRDLRGAIFCPLSFSGNISRSNANIATKLSVPSLTSILHMLTKGKWSACDRSAANDVRVTSCFPILGRKYGFAGNAVSRTVFKIKSIAAYQNTHNKPCYQSAISDFQIFENFENWVSLNSKFWNFVIYPKISKIFKNPNICDTH